MRKLGLSRIRQVKDDFGRISCEGDSLARLSSLRSDGRTKAKRGDPLRVFAISDLHLSGAVDKPMDIFGEEWENHAERIARNWDLEVGSSDLVLIPGDISWAMTLNEAKPDLSWIADRPGLKVMVRGNHDYWWSSI